MEKAARNLYVVAGAIIAYLLAGADLDQLTVLGLRAPARYPIVFSWASVVALAWFWWRYQLSWLKEQSGTNFRNTYLRELHQSKPLEGLVRKSVDHDRIVSAYNQRKGTHIEGVDNFVGFGPPSGTERRLTIVVGSLTYRLGGSSYKILYTGFPDKKPIHVRVPWWFHWWYSPRAYFWKAVRENDFSIQ